MGALVYLDLETTHLDPGKGQIWEIAYAVGDGPIITGTVMHDTYGASPEALEVSRYHERIKACPVFGEEGENDLFFTLIGATVVGANPGFDTRYLTARWSESPWHYRLFDIEAYAMGALGHDAPQGMSTIVPQLRELGFEIPEADHTAAGDVAALRASHKALRSMYAAVPVAS